MAGSEALLASQVRRRSLSCRDNPQLDAPTPLLAPQINGGGCLAPPTPQQRSNNVLGDALESYFKPEKQTSFDKYSQRLPQSLAWRSTTAIAEVVGMGAYINPNNMTVPEDPNDMGMVMRNGRRERVSGPRRTGDPLVWATTQMRASDAVREHVYGPPEVEKIQD